MLVLSLILIHIPIPIPVPILNLELWLSLPIAHDPAPLAALVDRSHELLTSKKLRKTQGAAPLRPVRSGPLPFEPARCSPGLERNPERRGNVCDRSSDIPHHR
jgi:hypothetical protein